MSPYYTCDCPGSEPSQHCAFWEWCGRSRNCIHAAFVPLSGAWECTVHKSLLRHSLSDCHIAHCEAEKGTKQLFPSLLFSICGTSWALNTCPPKQQLFLSLLYSEFWEVFYQAKWWQRKNVSADRYNVHQPILTSSDFQCLIANSPAFIRTKTVVALLGLHIELAGCDFSLTCYFSHIFYFILLWHSCS